MSFMAPTVPNDPLAVLLGGSLQWGQQHGGQLDPLAARAAQGRNAAVVPYGQAPPAQVVDDSKVGLERVAQLTSHGPREGLAHTTFDLGNGMRANVYYDHRGRRKTFVYAAGDQAAPAAPAA